MSLRYIAPILFFVAILGFATLAYANPLFFGQGARTATATTTPAYMTVGTGTTTLTYDTYNRAGTNQTDIGNTNGTNYAILLTRFTGSSTLSTLNINLEYSQDGVDWYTNTLGTYGGLTASTTNVTNITTLANAQTMAWTFASSTVGGAALTTTNGATSTRAIMVPTPARFVRAVYSMTGDRGAVWGEFVAAKEIK